MSWVTTSSALPIGICSSGRDSLGMPTEAPSEVGSALTLLFRRASCQGGRGSARMGPHKQRGSHGSRIRHGRQMTGEPVQQDARKVVTVLFADISGSTGLGQALDPESLRAHALALFRRDEADRGAPRRARLEVHRRRRDGRLRPSARARGRRAAGRSSGGGDAARPRLAERGVRARHGVSRSRSVPGSTPARCSPASRVAGSHSSWGTRSTPRHASNRSPSRERSSSGRRRTGSFTTRSPPSGSVRWSSEASPPRSWPGA